MPIFTKVAAEIFAAFTAGGVPRKVDNAEVQTWGTELESALATGNTFAAEFGIVPDTGADLTAGFVAAAAAAAALPNGAQMELPAGVYDTDYVPISNKFMVSGAGGGVGVTIRQRSSARRPLVEWTDARNFMNCRATANVTVTSGVPFDLTVRAMPGTYQSGDRITIWKRNDTWFRPTITNYNAATKTFTCTHTASATIDIGDLVIHVDNPGSEFAGIENVYLEGNRDTAVGLDNVCLAQTRASAGLLTLNGDTLWGDGSCRAAFRHNTRVRFASASNNSGVTITVKGYAIKKDGTETTLITDTFAGPGGGEAKPVYTPSLFNRITEVSVSGALTGNIWAGLCTLGDGAGLCVWGQAPRVRNVLIQKCRGWGSQWDWPLYPEGWTSSFATQVGEIKSLQAYLCDGGGHDFNAPVDGIARELYANQCENQTLAVRRMAPGFKVRDGHVSAAYENSTRFTRQFETVYIEADESEITGLACEGGSIANVVVLANNVKLFDTRLFDPNSSPFAGSERAIGVWMGSAALGWAATKCVVRTKTQNCSGGHLWMDSDGGENDIEIMARDQATALSSAVLTGATVLPISAAMTVANGETIWIELTSGAVDQRVVSSSTSSQIVVTVGLSGAASSGAVIARGLAVGGTGPSTSFPVPQRSRIRVDGYGINNRAYRFNWHEQAARFDGDEASGTALALYGRSTDNAGALRFYSNAGSLYGTVYMQSGAMYLIVGGTQLSIDGSGNFYTTNAILSPPASQSLSANGQMALQATSNTQATLKFRGSDGVTRSVNFTLT